MRMRLQDRGKQVFKRSLSVGMILALTVMTVLSGVAVLGTSHNTVQFVLGNKTFVNKGVETAMDVAPFAEGGRTFVPVRFLAQGLGVAENDIKWDAVNQQVRLTKGMTTITLRIGSNELMVNGIATMMDTAPMIRDSRTFLPARFVAEAMGYAVGWVQATSTVVISSEMAQVYNVELKGFAFIPQSLTIKKGDSVMWTNRDNVGHTILMNGEESNLMQIGQTFTKVFNEAGTYNYICGPHPKMTGTIIVQ